MFSLYSKLFLALFFIAFVSARPETSYLPEISADLSVDTEKGVGIRGELGIVDFRGAFVYGSLIIAFLLLVSNLMGVAVVPDNVANAVSNAAQRLDVRGGRARGEGLSELLEMVNAAIVAYNDVH